MNKAVIVSKYGMGVGDEDLAILLLRRYPKADLESENPALPATSSTTVA